MIDWMQYGWAGMLFALLIGHALADYPLQGEYMSGAKCPDFWKKQPKSSGMEWLLVASAHALIHAGFVWLITGRISLGIAEFILHFVIDFLKCRNFTTFSQDQLCHVACKVGFVIYLIAVT